MRRLATIFMLGLLLANTAAAYDFRAVAEQHIVPRYQALANSTATLATAADNYCKQRNDTEMQKLRRSYAAAFNAWQGIQHIRFGPIQYLSREHRLQLWPDKRGTVGKHLARLLADPVLDGDSPIDLDGRSVAVQGFSALEQLLYREQTADQRSCRLMREISANLRDIGARLVTDWTTGDPSYADNFNTPGAGDSIFESDTELAGQLLNSLFTQLEFMLTQKLQRPLGDDISKARGRRSEGWRSATGNRALQQNLAAAHTLYQAAFAAELTDESLQQRIESAFQDANAALAGIELPIAAAVEDAGQRPHVEQLAADISTVKRLIATDMARSLGLSLGFNSLDGD